MLFLALQALLNTFAVIYVASAVLYFAHCVLVWKTWAWAKKQEATPWWVRSNMCWKLAGDGYFPLTNGRVMTHAAIALTPVYNTALLATQIGYLVVDTTHRLWKRYANPWWQREAPMKAPKA